MSARDDIIKVAKSYIGVHGGSIAHAELISIFNTVKPFGYTAHTTDYWCAEFVTACCIQAFGKKTAIKYFPLSAACLYMINKAKQMDIWVENDAYKPQKGDFILYDWDDSGYGDNKNVPDHVGIVEKVSGNTITVIEGNMSNVCGRRKITVNGKYIRGYVTPHYEEIKTDKVAKKTTKTIVKEVLSGEWGNGDARRRALVSAGYDYNKIQKEVNRIVQLTNDTLDNKYGVGEKRKTALGKDYDLVQWNINRIYKEKEKTK